MSNPLPGPRTTLQRRPTLNQAVDTGVGVLISTESELEVTPKVTIADTFTNLNDFVTIYGTPTATSGNLAGSGLVRHKTQALTDSHKASAVVGSVNYGKTRLVICADEAFSSYYAVEIDHNLGFGDRVHFLKGTPGSSVEAAPGLLGILASFLSMLFGILSIFSTNTTPAATSTTTTLQIGDEFSIWYDQPNSTVRIYKNASALLNVPVPRGEIPHGEGNRWHGCAVGVEYDLLILKLGALMSSYACVDV